MTIREQMLELLSDGLPHTRAELHSLCGPSSRSTIRTHIHFIRRTLRPKGEDIICELHRRALCYRHVRLLRSPNE